MNTAGRAVVLYDGSCAFCRACVEWARRRDHLGCLEFFPYQEAGALGISETLRIKCAKSVHVLTQNGEAISAGRAVLYVLRLLPPWGWVRLFEYPPMIWFIEVGYYIVAALRPFLSRFVRV